MPILLALLALPLVLLVMLTATQGLGLFIAIPLVAFVMIVGYVIRRKRLGRPESTFTEAEV